MRGPTLDQRCRHLKNWPDNSDENVSVFPVAEIFSDRTPASRCLHRSFWFLSLAILVAAGCAQRRPVATGRLPPAPAPIPSAPAPIPGAPSAQPLPGVPAPPVLPPAYSEQGVASWYGLPFHGRKASDGEIFDMNQLVAAHRTLPFNSVVRVTNLNNGRQIDVRIIDRGPFVAGALLTCRWPPPAPLT